MWPLWFHAEAVKWFRKAADQGDAGAQLNLGLMYLDGLGVPKDYAEAIKWFRKAAEQGIAQAQYNLGVMYWRGERASQDFVQAYMWLKLSAAQGVLGAQKSSDKLAERMTPAQIAEA
ncbi:MAG: tetratricopeptide repeat protein [Syntrophobacteraceae bacterium]